MLSYIVVYTCFWWIIFYIALPIGNKVPQIIEKGHADSAPTNPKLGLKAVITSLIALPITYLVVIAIESKKLAKLFTSLVN